MRTDKYTMDVAENESVHLEIKDIVLVSRPATGLLLLFKEVDGDREWACRLTDGIIAAITEGGDDELK